MELSAASTLPQTNMEAENGLVENHFSSTNPVALGFPCGPLRGSPSQRPIQHSATTQRPHRPRRAPSAPSDEASAPRLGLLNPSDDAALPDEARVANDHAARAAADVEAAHAAPKRRLEGRIRSGTGAHLIEI